MTRRTLLSLLLIVLGTSAARADRKAGAVHRATQDLHYFAWALGILTEGKWDPGRSLSAEASCVTAIERAHEHGLDDSEVLRDPSFEHAPNGRRSGNYHYEITLGEAPALCSAYGAAAGPFLHQAEAAEALKPFDGTLLWMENVAPGHGGGDVGKRLEKAAAECPTALDKVLAAGARLDAKVVIRDVEKTLGKAHKEICDALAAKVPAYMAKHEEILRTERERAMAPYVAAGIAGEKLELMITWDGVGWRGVGGDVVRDPAKLAKARVLFHWLEDGDGIHTVRRFQFSGNKLVGKSERTYYKRPGSDAFR